MAKKMKLDYDKITLDELIGSHKKNDGRLRLIQGRERNGALSKIRGEESRYEMLQEFLKNPNNPNSNITSDQLIDILSELTADSLKSGILQSFLNNSNNPNCHIGIDQLTIILSGFGDERDKYRILYKFLTNLNNPNRNITSNQLIGILSICRFDETRFRILKLFLNNPENVATIDDFIRGNGIVSKFEDDRFRYKALELFLSSPNNGVTINDFIGDDSKLSKCEDEFIKFRVLQLFFNDPNNHVTPDQLLDILSKIQREDIKSDLLKSFLNNNHISFDELAPLLRKFESSNTRFQIIKSFLENSNNHTTFNQFNTVLSWFKDRNPKRIVTESFLNNSSNEITIYEFVGDNGILSRFEDGRDKFNLALLFAQKRDDVTLDDLIIMIKASGISYRVDSIYKLYDGLSRQNQFRDTVIDDLVYISKNMGYSLDNSEFMRIEFVKELLNKGRDRLVVDDNLIIQFRNFLGEINQDENYSNIFDFINRKLNLSDRDILLLSQGRINSKYSSIKDILDNQEGITNSLQSCLTPEGISSLQNIFGDNILDLKIDDRSINLLDIFSYFDARDALGGFSKIVKPEIIQDIKTSFHPSKDILLISENEMEKIKSLLNDDDIDKRYISLRSLCLIVKKKQQELNFQYDGKEINFDGIDISDEKKKALNIELGEIYHGFSTGKYPEAHKILKFLKESCELDKEEVKKIEAKTINYTKLFDFFKLNYKDITCALTSEKIGAKTFGCIIPSLDDGCTKNIGSQLKLLVINVILKNVCEIIFYNGTQKIITNILNSGGDVIFNDNNPFESEKVMSYYASAPAFLKIIVDKIKERRINPMTQEQEDKKILKDLGFDENSKITEVMASFDRTLKEDVEGIEERIQDQVLDAIGYMVIEKILKDNPQSNQSMDSLDFLDLKFNLSDYQQVEGREPLSSEATIEELYNFVQEQFANQITPRRSIQVHSANVMNHNNRDSTMSLQ